MKSTKVFEVVQTFNKYEQNRVRKFLQSPYYNGDHTIVELFDLLTNLINQIKKENLSKENAWQKIGAEGAYDDVRFRKYCSDLLKLIQTYLALEIYNANPLYEASFLIEAVGRRKLEKLYNGTVKAARELSKKEQSLSAQYFLFIYQIEKNFYDLQESEIHRVEKSNIDLISKNLDTFYFAEKLRYYCSAITQQTYVNHAYEIHFIEEVIKLVEQHQLTDVPTIGVYYQIYLTLVDGENYQHYEKLKTLLDEFGTSFPKNEALSIYYSAVNYCIRKINSGKLEFYDELFRLYKDLVEKQIIFSESDEISPWDFKNISLIGLNTKNFQWTENFIKTCGDKVPEPYRQNAITYNLGQLYFYQKKYSKVLEQLRNVEYDDITYSLNSKAFLTWTYFELDEIELLLSHIDSFKTYLKRRADISQSRKNRYITFLKVVKKLSNILPGERKALQKIKDEVEMVKGEGFVGINWVKEKIAELEQ